jgi:DNA repair protein RecO
MSYHIYTTEGIILKRAPFGEANLLLYILTADLGLIIASARSARVSASKLRPALQEYAHVTVSCVKGKGGWKVTNVVSIENYFFETPLYAHKVLAQSVSLLIKMMPGEAIHPAVFSLVKSSFDELKNIQKENLESFEMLMVLRVMFELGYVAKNEVINNFLNNSLSWSQDTLIEISNNRSDILGIINKAIKESQL